jgi:hypothetical protein
VFVLKGRGKSTIVCRETKKSTEVLETRNFSKVVGYKINI